MLNSIIKILKILDFKKKKEFKILIVLMFFSMLLETIGIGAMIPLINFFTDQNIILPYNINFSETLLSFGISENHIINIILIIIVTIFLLKNIYLGFYSWIESKFAYKIRFDLGVRLFNKYLYSPYEFHLSNNSANLTTKIVQESANYGAALISLSTLLTEMLIVFGLVTFLLIIKPQETIIIILIGFISSTIFYLALKKLISRWGKKRELSEKARMKSLKQGLGGIKDIIFYKAQRYFVDIFHSDSDDTSEVSFKMYFTGKLPRVWFEMIAVIIMTFVIFYLSFKEANSSEIMATIGIFLISSIRIIPSINRILTSLQTIKFYEPTLDSILADLDSKNLKLPSINKTDGTKSKIDFKKEIKFNNVYFNYSKSEKDALKNISLTIKKNEFVGIVGETGSGKSTLVDLFIGLLKPTKGTITVDGKDVSDNLEIWKDSLGYVPQNFYLLDESVKNNIAFGYKENQIDVAKVENSIEKSQLTKFIKDLKNDSSSNIGERGVNISGGEKQRIGIARALYNDPDILLFDEATSSLDSETEKRILETLIKFKKNKTIIFITHRNSSLSYCDKVFKIQNKEIKEIKNNF
jgi:ABC-type multidrug transport system fused ATPase/permease subunit